MLVTRRVAHATLAFALQAFGFACCGFRWMPHTPIHSALRFAFHRLPLPSQPHYANTAPMPH